MTGFAVTAGSPEPLGVSIVEGGINVAVFARHASRIELCLFDEAGERETARLVLPRRSGDVHHGFVPGIGAGARYGLRADGPYEPSRGHRYDPAKLLVDPYATRLDRPFRYMPELSAPRSAALDTAPFVPRAVVTAGVDAASLGTQAARLPQQKAPGLIYEIAVKAFTKRHPGIRAPLRGTVAALAEGPAIEHLTRLGVTHVELMPVAAWMDERHLPPLRLANGWGYNPIVFMAPDPRLAPGGAEELGTTVERLHEVGIAVILDVVYNHTAESDAEGPTVSLRGLDNAVYYRHAADDPGRLVNDTACGNTLACDRAPVLRLIMDSMRHWAVTTGIDGFRFDLATTLGRDQTGFSPEAPLLSAIRQDPVLRELTLIAEPWDVGQGGYRLGAFPEPFHEWNDKYRDDVRRFWRGDAGAAGPLATRLAGSSDIFDRSFRRPFSSVNFVACHDGFTLADIVAYAQKHNEANGEANRDGTDDNHSWNNGVEGESEDGVVEARRATDRRALLATLFLSRGTPMLTAGDEFGRSQRGNNNAYCQDNEITWIDWSAPDPTLAGFVAGLMRLRSRHPVLRRDAFFTGKPLAEGLPPDVAWLGPSGQELRDADWAKADILGMAMACPENGAAPQRLCVVVNRSTEAVSFTLPDGGKTSWKRILDSAAGSFEGPGSDAEGKVSLAPRSVTAFEPAG